MPVAHETEEYTGSQYGYGFFEYLLHCNNERVFLWRRESFGRETAVPEPAANVDDARDGAVGNGIQVAVVPATQEERRVARVGKFRGREVEEEEEELLFPVLLEQVCLLFLDHDPDVVHDLLPNLLHVDHQQEHLCRLRLYKGAQQVKDVALGGDVGELAHHQPLHVFMDPGLQGKPQLYIILTHNLVGTICRKGYPCAVQTHLTTDVIFAGKK